MIPLINFLSHDMGRDEIRPPSRKGQKNAKHNKTYNNNNIFTFDTETTSFIYNDKKCSFVYIAMLYINGLVYYMRNLELFKQFLDMYNDPDTLNVIYVHNLGYDFTFLQNVIPFEKVFARKAHKPIFARYKNWEFRCSYFLSQMSLKTLGESYNLEHAKQSDFLNYRKRRHTDTPLTDEEDLYCEYDVRVLADYVQYELNRNGGKYRDIPYTQTGYVRRYVLEQSKADKQYYALRNEVERTQPRQQLFEILEKCYTGGYTHANFMAVSSGCYTHVKSYDFTSSYPAVMCRCKFPRDRFKEIIAHHEKYIYNDNYCCVGRFLLKHITPLTDLCYISKHKIIKGTCKNGAFSNGRLHHADELEIYLTDVDIQTLDMIYDYDFDCLELWAARSDYLPQTIVKSILTLYSNKTQYKGVAEKYAVYMASKQMINSVYGMCVFNPFCDDILYDAGEWDKDPATPQKLTKYYENRKTILPYQWGVFVTAWARNKLVNIASKIGDDVLYMDTDSIKFIGDYDYLFEKDNKKIHDENIKAAKHFELDFDLFAPADKKGVVHELGLWDFEHEYKSFKVLGCKRYAFTLHGSPEIFPVVAGCPTQYIKEYLQTHNCNALLTEFRLNLCLNENESGKNTITYHDNHDIDIPVTDYLGNTKIEHIGYGAYMEKTTFDMSLAPDYLAFLLDYSASDKIAMVRAGVMCE